MRRSEQPFRLLMTALVVLLVGCGQPRDRTDVPPSTANATTPFTVGTASDRAFNARGMTGDAVEVAVAADPSTGYTPRPAPPATGTRQDATRHDAIASFALVGTGIDGANAFAVVKMPDQGLVTVRESSLIGGYTVRGILPDRIRVTQDDKETTLVIGASVADKRSSTADAETPPSAASAESTTMAAGINTDQSIPEHVMYGPTARWPEGVKHVH